MVSREVKGGKRILLPASCGWLINLLMTARHHVIITCSRQKGLLKWNQLRNCLEDNAAYLLHGFKVIRLIYSPRSNGGIQVQWNLSAEKPPSHPIQEACHEDS